jgi:hypothetical protein
MNAAVGPRVRGDGRWLGAAVQSERGFWALGEAIVDAVVTRYPQVFAMDRDHIVEE